MRGGNDFLMMFSALGGVNVASLIQKFGQPVSNQVSTRYFTVSNSSANRQNNRIQRRMTSTLTGTGLILTYTGFFFQAGAGGDITQNATTKTVEQVWVEYPAGVMTQGHVVGTGATSFTLTNSFSSVVDVYFPVLPPEGALFWEQNSAIISGSNVFEAPNSTLSGDYNSYTLISGNSSKAQYPAGDPNAIAGSAGGGQAWGASLVWGLSNSPSFILGAGDSIADGAGGDQTVGIVENPGSIARFLENNYGFYRITCPSSSIPSGYNALNILNAARGRCKYAFLQEGINNVLGGDSLALMQLKHANFVKNARQAGARDAIQCTLLPNTNSVSITSLTSSGTTATATVADTSLMTNGMNVTVAGATPAAYNGTYAATVVDATHFSYTFAGGTSPATGTITWGDGWSSYASQAYTSQTSAAKETVRQGFNTWLTSTKAGGSLDAVFDLAGIITDPAHPNLWPTLAYMQANGATGNEAATFDGTHPSTTFNNWAFQMGKTAFEAIIATLEASNSSPKGLGTQLKTLFAQPTKKTAQFTMANVSQPWWQYFGAYPISLTDQSTGTSSGWVANQSGAGWVSSSTQTLYDVGNYHEFPDNVIGTFYRISATADVQTITGLNPAKTYNLSILCGAGGTGNNTSVTVSGLIAGSPVIITAGTTTNGIAIGNADPAHWSNIAPDAGGNITVSIVRAAGQTYGVFNALSIQEN